MYETCTEGGHDDVVTLFQQMFILPKCQGNGCCRSVSEMLDIDHHLLHRKLQTLGDSLNDTHVGLVGNNPLNVVLVQTVALGNEMILVAVTILGHRILEEAMVTYPLEIPVIQK